MKLVQHRHGIPFGQHPVTEEGQDIERPVVVTYAPPDFFLSGRKQVSVTWGRLAISSDSRCRAKAIPEDSELKHFLNAERYTISDEELLKQLCGLK